MQQLSLTLQSAQNAHDLQALKAFITVPQSSLLSYTATDTTDSSDVTRNVAHKSLAYKVCLCAAGVLHVLG